MAGRDANFKFDNRYHHLPEMFFTKVNPSPARAPKLLLFNEKLAESLGLNPYFFKTEAGAHILSGNNVPKGAEPLAQAYAGHQFGQFTMLGDGRAILLGEQITANNERFDIQLKGAGKTAYSRGGDGRGVLGPMLREYIVSEAMHSLNVPTTRALAVTETGNPVYREDIEKGAVLTRVASSHLRVGTFQYVAAWGTKDDLKTLADYAIDRHYPPIKDDENPYVSLLKQVIDRQAHLIAKWQLLGFIHGVMNTDNMTISGETIDYGPCAFIDKYDPNTVFSSIDRDGRYRYNNQPAIGAWNLTRFAETLIPLIDSDEEKAIELAQQTLMTYKGQYEFEWSSGMRLKLGLQTEGKGDGELISRLLQIMEEDNLDYTNTFIHLTTGDIDGFNENERLQQWIKKWQDRLIEEEKSAEQIKLLMQRHNPSILPRNYYVEEALQKANEGDMTYVHALNHALSHPFAYTEEQKKYRYVPDDFKYYKTFCGT